MIEVTVDAFLGLGPAPGFLVFLDHPVGGEAVTHPVRCQFVRLRGEIVELEAVLE